MAKFVYTIALLLVGVSPAFAQIKHPQTTGGPPTSELGLPTSELGSPLAFMGCIFISDLMEMCPQIGKKPPYIKVKRGVNINKTARLVLTEMCKISHSECVLPRKK